LEISWIFSVIFSLPSYTMYKDLQKSIVNIFIHFLWIEYIMEIQWMEAPKNGGLENDFLVKNWVIF